MYDYEEYDNAIRKQQNSNVRAYYPLLESTRGNTKELSELARIFGLDTSKIKRTGGGSNVLQVVRRWFTDAIGGQRPLLDTSYTGRSLLMEDGARMRKVIAAQGLTEAGIERETSEEGQTYIHEEHNDTLTECIEYCQDLINMNETGEGLQGQRFLRFRPDDDRSERTQLAEWVRLTIGAGTRSKWMVSVHWVVISSSAMMALIDQADNRNIVPAKQRKAPTKQNRQVAQAMMGITAESFEATGNTATPENVVKHLEYWRWLENVEQVAPGVYAADLGEWPDGWAQVARAGSKLTTGHWWHRATGVTWRNGTNSTIIIPHDALRTAEAIRPMIRDLTGEEPAWTIPGMARQCLDYVQPHADSGDASLYEWLIEGGKWGYMQCVPETGVEGVHLDVTSYYYEIARRAKSTKPVIDTNGSVRWVDKHSGTTDAYREMLDAVQDMKALRNTIVGCMATGGLKTNRYYRGQQSPMRIPNSSWSALGWLIVRSGWEITQRAAEESGAALAITDCIISTRGTPAIWRDLGFGTHEVARGEVQVCSPTTFRVGPRQTLPYQRGDRTALRMPPPESPRMVIYPAWVA